MGSVAARYAHALFDAGIAEGKSKEIRYGSLLEAFTRSIGESDAFRRMLGAPQITRGEKKAFLASIFADPDDSPFLEFLKALVDKGRIDMIETISLDYRRLLLESQNVLEALIESAFALDDDMVTKITASFKKKTGASEIRAKVRVDPSLIGGVRVTIGSTIFDGTTRSGLDRLFATMKN